MSSDVQHHQFAVITDACGNAPYHLLLCPNAGCGTLADKWRYNNRFKWAVTLYCGICSPEYSWTVCRFCPKQRVHMFEGPQIKRHQSKFHSSIQGICQSSKVATASVLIDAHNLSSPPEEGQNPLAPPEEEDFTVQSDMEVSSTLPSHREIVNASSANMVESELMFLNFSRSESNSYFKHILDGGHGRALLASKACFNNELASAEMDIVDVDLCHHLAKLSFVITRGQREILAEVLRLHVFKNLKNPGSSPIVNANDSRWVMDVPQSVPSLRSYFLEGSRAYIENLPHPPIRMIGQFAYVSLIDCIADLLGHGLPTDTIQVPFEANVVTRLGESKMALKVLENAQNTHSKLPDLVLWISEWSDSFEPNGSTKKNRGSVHVKTVTIALPHKAKNARYYTYCICIGPSKGELSAVESEFKLELECLKSVSLQTFFHGKFKRMVTVHAELIVSVQDQPERRGANYLMLGNTRFTSRWLYIMDYKAVYGKVNSCRGCLSQLLSNGECNDDCRLCACWSMDKPRHINKLLFAAPDKYPEDCSILKTVEPPMLPPRSLTYEIMKQAVSIAHDKFVENKWTAANVRSYLTAVGINTVATKQVIEHAINANSLLLIDKDLDAEDYATIMAFRAQNPLLFEKWKTPALWDRGLLLSQHIDAIMHLLFLGVVKTVMKDTQDWLKMKRKFEGFLVIAKTVLSSITDLGLSWCHAVPYGTGKFGGHVSENYLACARLSKWFYNLLSKVVAKKLFVEPTTNQAKWVKPINVEWLKIRGLDTEGDAATIRERVRFSLNQTDGPPPVLPESGGNVDCVEAMYCALLALISRVMSESTSPLLLISVHRHVRIFLDLYEDFDKNIRKDDDDPSWTTHYNFLSLLNLKQQMFDYGPVRNLWEGSYRGERIIASLKPEITGGLRKNWAPSLMRKVMKKAALETVERDCESESKSNLKENGGNFDRQQPEGMYKKYKSISEIRNQFIDRQPLSITIHGSGLFSCQTIDDGQVMLSCVKYVKTEFGFCYHEWSIGEYVSSSINDVDDYGILLPCLCADGYPPRVNSPTEYGLITSRWLEMLDNGTIGRPTVLGAVYNDMLI